MKTKLIGIGIVTAVVVLLASLAFSVRIGATADSVAVLHTTGMTCGSCASTITETLQKVKGVAVAEVDVTGGWVLVGYEAKAVSPELLAAKVSGSGFKSDVQKVLTPAQFKQITGRDLGGKATVSGCCGGKNGGCNAGKQS
jgi:copper chaperone CopZ